MNNWLLAAAMGLGLAGCSAAASGHKNELGAPTPSASTSEASPPPSPVPDEHASGSVKTDAEALAMANGALASFSVSCGNQPGYQDSPLDQLWSVGGRVVNVNVCLGGSEGWGAEFSWNLTGLTPLPAAGYTRVNPKGEGSYVLRGANFVLELGTSKSAEACRVKKDLTLPAELVPVNAPEPGCT